MDSDTRHGLVDLETAAQLTGLTQTDITDLCRSYYVHAFVGGGMLQIFSHDIDKLRQLSETPRLLGAAKVLGGSFMYDYHPELSDYLYFHDTLDIFCWLLKLRYSDPVHIRKRDYCVFRGKPNADFGVSRTGISVDVEHRFRPKANARFGRVEQPFRSMSNTSAG